MNDTFSWGIVDDSEIDNSLENSDLIEAEFTFDESKSKIQRQLYKSTKAEHTPDNSQFADIKTDIRSISSTLSLPDSFNISPVRKETKENDPFSNPSGNYSKKLNELCYKPILAQLRQQLRKLVC